ncbi:hypothetical protein CPLU01_11292 [Colletotrichum plurivorum]|uniref:Zn(2)-C6 fungal-type domain-containing protein n=1 Tax=Colletotrichum plurivorum TaxID=2175906 RepID=A0A8H6K3E5_9PEZI|nr:hypothetical protein CPLU01_11292 [Colletotrichum plurivorum]
MPPPRTRQACDRCHGQKLRCPKQPGSAVCTRCSKAAVPCVYSPSGPLPPPAPPPQDLFVTGAPNDEIPSLDWLPFSFDQLPSPSASALALDGEQPRSTTTTPVPPLGPRAECSQRLSTVMATLTKAFDALPPPSKLHIPPSDLKACCMKLPGSHGLRTSLESMLSQTQELIDLYPVTIRLAVDQKQASDCALTDCIHLSEPHPDLGQSPYHPAALSASTFDYALLNLLVSCHCRVHDIIELILCHAQICFTITSGLPDNGIEQHSFDIPELRVGSYVPSSRASAPIITTILIDLQSNLAGRIPTLRASIDESSTMEGQILLLQCAMLKDRAESVAERLQKLRAAAIKAGFF